MLFVPNANAISNKSTTDNADPSSTLWVKSPTNISEILIGNNDAFPESNAYAVPYATNEFANKTLKVESKLGINIGNPTCIQYWKLFALNIFAASLYSSLKALKAGINKRVAKGIWK